MKDKLELTSTAFSQADATEKAPNSPLTYFIGGFLFGLIAYAVAGASMESTHTTLVELGAVKVATVAAIPFVCGGLSVWLKDSFVSPLEKLVNSVATLIG